MSNGVLDRAINTRDAEIRRLAGALAGKYGELDDARALLDECLEAFRHMKLAADARKFLKCLGIKPEAYAGDGRQLLADEMFRRISVHRAAK